jgi:Fe-S-cluster containining protein
MPTQTAIPCSLAMPSRHLPALPTVTDCEGCGVCCLHMGYPAFVHGLESQDDEQHWTSLPSELKTELQRFIAEYAAPDAGQLDGPCFWLDPETRKCKHHRHRPRVCRDFQVGSQGCLDWRAEYRIESS